MKTSGQIAFEAYNAERGGVTYDGKPTPPWDALGDGVRSGWEAAARAVLPDPAAVRAARTKAAEVIEGRVAAARSPWSLARSEREVANDCAATIRDLARQYLGTHDEGGDVDATTLAMIALDVDGLATLGELEEKVRELREVE